MAEGNDRIRKAAVLVTALGRDGADALLEQLSADDARRIRDMAVSLGDPNEDEEHRVLEEFLAARAAPGDASVELDRDLATRLEASPPNEHAATIANPRPQPRFAFLHDVELRQVAALLEHEHPQLTALVVAHLPPARAAEMLALLSPDRQATVARRVAQISQADDEALQEVEAHLQRWLLRHGLSDTAHGHGLSTLSEILTAAPEDQRNTLLAHLECRDRHLALRLRSSLGSEFPSSGTRASSIAMEPTERDPLRPQATDHLVHKAAPAQPGWLSPAAPALPDYDFADVAELDEAALAVLLREADPETLRLALAGASGWFVERVLRLFPRRTSKALRTALDRLGPTRLSDVSEAQRRLAELAARLTQQGRIRSAQTGLSVAA